MLLKLTLQSKAHVSDCRLMATAQNETDLKKRMLTTFPFVIHFLSPSVNGMKLEGKKERKERVPPHKTDVEAASSHTIMVFPRRL